MTYIHHSRHTHHLYASRGFVLRRTGNWYIWSSVLRRKFSGKMPCLRIAEKRVWLESIRWKLDWVLYTRWEKASRWRYSGRVIKPHYAAIKETIWWWAIIKNMKSVKNWSQINLGLKCDQLDRSLSKSLSVSRFRGSLTFCTVVQNPLWRNRSFLVGLSMRF